MCPQGGLEESLASTGTRKHTNKYTDSAHRKTRRGKNPKTAHLPNVSVLPLSPMEGQNGKDPAMVMRARKFVTHWIAGDNQRSRKSMAFHFWCLV